MDKSPIVHNNVSRETLQDFYLKNIKMYNQDFDQLKISYF